MTDAGRLGRSRGCATDPPERRGDPVRSPSGAALHLALGRPRRAGMPAGRPRIVPWPWIFGANFAGGWRAPAASHPANSSRNILRWKWRRRIKGASEPMVQPFRTPGRYGRRCESTFPSVCPVSCGFAVMAGTVVRPNPPCRGGQGGHPRRGACEPPDGPCRKMHHRPD